MLGIFHGIFLRLFRFYGAGGAQPATPTIKATCGVPSTGLHRARTRTVASPTQGRRWSCAKRTLKLCPRVGVAVPDLSVVCSVRCGGSEYVSTDSEDRASNPFGDPVGDIKCRRRRKRRRHVQKAPSCAFSKPPALVAHAAASSCATAWHSLGTRAVRLVPSPCSSRPASPAASRTRRGAGRCQAPPCCS